MGSRDLPARVTELERRDRERAAEMAKLRQDVRWLMHPDTVPPRDEPEVAVAKASSCAPDLGRYLHLDPADEAIEIPTTPPPAAVEHVAMFKPDALPQLPAIPAAQREIRGATIIAFALTILALAAYAALGGVDPMTPPGCVTTRPACGEAR